MRTSGTTRTLMVGLIPALFVSLGVYAQLLELRERADPSGARPLVMERATLRSPLFSLDRETARRAAREAGASAELVEAVSDLPATGPSLASTAARVGFPSIANDRIQELFDSAASMDSAWRQFFQEYPERSGLLHFTPVVTARGGDEAMVVETFRCGPECGQARLLLLEQGPAGWTLMAEVPLWVP